MSKIKIKFTKTQVETIIDALNELGCCFDMSTSYGRAVNKNCSSVSKQIIKTLKSNGNFDKKRFKYVI